MKPATTDEAASVSAGYVEPFVKPLWQWPQFEYEQLAEQSLLQNGYALLAAEPADSAEFCPAWPALSVYERLRFWSNLLAAMALEESSHNPAAFHVERFNDRFGEPVVSRGLLQISQESANGYGCGIAEAAELHEPARNIDCAVKILSRWVPRDGHISAYVSGAHKPWRGGARYWSVLRRNHKTASIQQRLQNSVLCRVPNVAVSD